MREGPLSEGTHIGGESGLGSENKEEGELSKEPIAAFCPQKDQGRRS